MDVRQSARQMIDFQKIAMDSWFNAATLFQTQAASMLDIVLGHSPGIPEESRQTVREWFNACGQAQDRFKTYVNDSFSGFACIMDEPRAKSAPKPAKSNSKEGE